MIRAILVDDEESALLWLGELLAVHPDVEVAGMARSVTEAERLLERVRPDVVFLDISMPRQGGMTLFGSVDANLPVVLVTAHDDRMLEAFEEGAFDYLLKPVTALRLERTIDRLRGVPRRPLPAPAGAEDVGRITVPTRKGTAVLPLADVLWVEARQNYSLLRLRDGGSLLVKRLLGDFGEELPSRLFARIGRSLVVNVAGLRSIDRPGGSGAHLRFAGSSETLAIGRAAAARLRQRLSPRSPSEPPPP